MEYDFSGIETEELREVKKSRKDVCGGIICSKCPFYGAVCNAGNNDMIYNEFCKELIRREKVENKMPELEVGMIVEKIWSEIGTQLYLVLGNGSWGSCLTSQGYSDPIREQGEITRIFVPNESCSIYKLKSIENLKLIWSKKSDKDIKIEELEKTINEAQRQIQELKES